MKDPENRIKWLSQHEGMRDFDPPYVYHVVSRPSPLFTGRALTQQDKDNMEGLKAAIEAAIANPIEPYIRKPTLPVAFSTRADLIAERMKKENVEKRLLHLIHHDWASEVELLIANGTVKGYLDIDMGENVRPVASDLLSSVCWT